MTSLSHSSLSIKWVNVIWEMTQYDIIHWNRCESLILGLLSAEVLSFMHAVFYLWNRCSVGINWNSRYQEVLNKSTCSGIILYMHPANETTLHCNVVSHCLGAYTKWSLPVGIKVPMNYNREGIVLNIIWKYCQSVSWWTRLPADRPRNISMIFQWYFIMKIWNLCDDFKQSKIPSRVCEPSAGLVQEACQSVYL